MAQESLEEIMARWNPPPTSNAIEMLVGKPTEDGDVAATAHYPNPLASPTSDNAIQYADDGDGAVDAEDYSDEEVWNFQALKDEIDKRNEDRDDEDRISKGGSADDLRARLVEDDAAEPDEG